MDIRVAVEGAELHVSAEGSGRAVLVPTGGGIPFYRNSFSRALAERLQFVYIEMRGTGGSSGSVDGATFASLADDVEAVRAALGIERPIVLGHSNHGCIALEHGLRYPGVAAGIVTVASVPNFGSAFVTGQQRWEERATADGRARLAELQAEFAAVDLGRLSADEQMLQRYLSMGPLGWHDPYFDSSPLWEGAPVGMAAYFGWLFERGSAWNAADRLHAMEAPLLALCGRHDYLCPGELWEEPIQRVPRGELQIFERSAHNPQYEEQALFDSVLLGWVSRLAA